MEIVKKITHRVVQNVLPLSVIFFYFNSEQMTKIGVHLRKLSQK